jgi:hypothetical protein
MFDSLHSGGLINDGLKTSAAKSCILINMEIDVASRYELRCTALSEWQIRAFLPRYQVPTIPPNWPSWAARTLSVTAIGGCMGRCGGAGRRTGGTRLSLRDGQCNVSCCSSCVNASHSLLCALLPSFTRIICGRICSYRLSLTSVSGMMSCSRLSPQMMTISRLGHPVRSSAWSLCAWMINCKQPQPRL